MRYFVKVCGITEREVAEAAVAAGVDALGFVFHPGSPRAITPERAAGLVSGLPDEVERVAVFLRPEPGQIDAVLAVFHADTVQADHSYLGHVSHPHTLPVYRSGETVDPRPGRFLYEGHRSGVGMPVDWEEAAVVAGGGGMILAGGLNSENVTTALRTVRPAGVDVSSGVETGRGQKDPVLVTRFIETVRTAERGEVTT